MTNVQISPSKSQPTESGRAEMGNFFQAAKSPLAGNLSNPDFDSFLSDPESKTQAKELQEEQEAAKKRKKLIDAALAHPTIQAQEPLVELVGKKDQQLGESKILDQVSLQDLNANSADSSAPNSPDSPDSTLEKTTPSKSSESSSESSEKVSAEDQFLPLTEDQTKTDIVAESDSETRGMETASVDDEMIALAPVDGSESPTQTLCEPAITSINRRAAYAVLDRGAIAPLGNSANSSDSGLGNPASGMPTPIQTIRPQAATASSQATTLFKSLAPELDKFKQTGSSQIQLDLPVNEQESVRIKLSLRGGEIRSTFITDSPELREALQKAWPEFSQNSRDRGYRLGDPAFQQGFQENNANLGENSRRQSDSRPYETGEAFAPTTLRKGTSNRSTTSQTPSTALWA